MSTGRKIFNKFRTKDNKFEPIGFKGKFLDFIQMMCPFLRDDEYFSHRILKKNNKLRFKILTETNWLAITTYYGSERRGLAFHEQAAKYYEYQAMIVQRRSQYAIIALTIALLIMTGLQIYLQFWKR